MVYEGRTESIGGKRLKPVATAFAIGLFAAGSGSVVAGCSSVIEGGSQTLTFNSDPSGADCILSRNGKLLGTVTTPGIIKVEKTKDNIQVVCSKDNYEDATAVLQSQVAGASFGNLLLGPPGGIGWAIDSATGADSKYDGVTRVNMTRRADASAPQGASAVPRYELLPPHELRYVPLPPHELRYELLPPHEAPAKGS